MLSPGLSPMEGWPQGPWGTPGPMKSPTIKVTFYGSLETLVFFLNQDQNGPAYFDDVAYVNVIVANLEREAAEWVTGLHDEGVGE
ncbi:RGAG4: Retrotransposon gag domain-containing protein 4 [Crotalus adamanteus]|uniref:RGAG4: Retrotransposon gag domain-containing protein 4 n=1 Tax=Crotalus adamanteus TaxID=8729 RepID=A0AAW1CCP5_CROAD